jgi:hypothetical protein
MNSMAVGIGGYWEFVLNVRSRIVQEANSGEGNSLIAGPGFTEHSGTCMGFPNFDYNTPETMKSQ